MTCLTKPIFCCVLSILVLSGFTQTPVYKNYSTQSGLPTNEIYEVCQSEDGYLYFASEYGLLKFDGFEFSKIPIKGGFKLTHSVFKVRIRPNDKRLVAFVSGAGLFELHDDTLFSLTQNHLLKNYRIKSGFRDVLFSNLGDAYVIYRGLSEGALICRLSGELDTLYSDVGPNYRYIELFQLPDHNKGIGRLKHKMSASNDQTEITINKNKNGWIVNVNFSESPTVYDWTRSVETRDYLWVNYSNKLLKKNKGTGELKVFHTNTGIVNIDQLKNGIIAVSTMDGLYLSYPGKDDLEYLFKGYFFSSAFQDREGGIWLTTLNNGVLYVPSLAIRKLDIPPITDSRINSIAINKNELSVVTYDKKLVCLNRENNSYRFIKNLDLSNSLVNHLTYYLGDLYAGALVLKKGHQSMAMIDRYIDNHKVQGSKVLYSTRYGVFKADNGGHVNLYENLSEQMRTFNWKDSLLYIGTNSGLKKLNLLTGKIQNNIIPVFLNTRIYDIEICENGNLIVGSKDGLAILNEDTQVLINRSNGLSSNLCKHIAIESDSVFWVGTERGVNRVELMAGEVRINRIGRPQGMLSENVYDIKYSNDSIYIATDNGLIFFNVNEIVQERQKSNLSIISIQINDSIIFNQQEFILSEKERNIRFNFSDISYRQGIETEYSYRLNGFHVDWVTSREGTAAYYNLPPGEYSFELKSRNRDVAWGNASISVPVVIPAVYYETGWFWILLALFIGSGLIALTYLYFRQIDNRRESQLRYSKLRLQALGLQMNPHFLFNALNSIQALAFSETHIKFNAFMGKFSSMTRKVLDSSTEPLNTLTEELANVEEYIEMEQIRFEDRPFHYSIEIDKAIPKSLKIPPMLLQPIVENAIWHGLNRKNGERNLWIICKQRVDYCEILIEDNGIGIISSGVGEKRSKNSLSLKNLKQRIKLYNQLNYGVASFKLEDINNSEGDTGTKAIFLFKEAKK